MAVKTEFSEKDLAIILSHYGVGTLARSEAVPSGTVQTNYIFATDQGKFVFRYYESRSRESVLFESELLTYLNARHYPCPVPIQDIHGTYVGEFRDKPYMVLEYIPGHHVEHPDVSHKQQLVQKTAELQTATRDFASPYTPHRWNYGPDLCRTLARAEASKIGTKDAHEKFAWLSHTLETLELPGSLPKGICHCDFHFSNVLFQEDRFVALIDFDDANYTYLPFDLVALVDGWTWPHFADMFDVEQARSIVQQYTQHRPLGSVEQHYAYDVHKLSILIDCVWFFWRGPAHDFWERRKIDALTKLGRQRYANEVIGHW